MATDLAARATAQAAALAAATTPIVDALAAARDDLAAASADRTAARSVVEALRAQEARTRVAIAEVANPADAQTHEDALRELLVELGAARVDLRDAEERVAAATATTAALTALAARSEATVAGAVTHVEWATERHEVATQLRDAVAAPPLDTIVADAGALLAGAEMSAADDRLDELLPTDLRSRAEARAAEAEAISEAARAADEADRARGDDRLVAASPLHGAVEVALRDLAEAEAALGSYVGSAAGRLDWARHALERVAALADLTPAQVTALDPAGRADAVAAAEAEDDLGGALSVEAQARRALDEAILDARLDDPTVDPETVQAVIDAREALEDGAVQGPLAQARADYDQAARDALDAWEVEVPPDLWDGLGSFLRARRLLQELSDAAARTELIDGLGDAEDALAAALDARDLHVTTGWILARDAAARAGAAAAATTTADDRAHQYLRGDGASGRTPAEL